MMQRYQPVTHGFNHNIEWEPGVAGAINILCELTIGGFLIMQLISMIGASKLEGPAAFFFIGGFIFLLVKLALAVYCTIWAFTPTPSKPPYDQQLIIIAGAAVIGMNLILLIFFGIVMAMLGSKDPTGLTMAILGVAMGMLALEIASMCVVVYNMGLYVPTPMYATPNRAEYPYFPVVQLGQ